MGGCVSLDCLQAHRRWEMSVRSLLRPHEQPCRPTSCLPQVQDRDWRSGQLLSPVRYCNGSRTGGLSGVVGKPVGRVAAALCGFGSTRVAAVVAEPPVHTSLEDGTLGRRGGRHRVRRLASVVCTEPGIGAVAGIGEVTLKGRVRPSLSPVGRASPAKSGGRSLGYRRRWDRAPHTASLERRAGSNGSATRLEAGVEPAQGWAQKDGVLVNDLPHPLHERQDAIPRALLAAEEWKGYH
jgi:hypothetical protein